MRGCARRARAAPAPSGLTGQPLKRATAARIEARDLLGEVTERHVAVLGDEALDLCPRAPRHELVAVEPRRVEVGLALSAPIEHALLMQASHDRHVRRVGPLFA